MDTDDSGVSLLLGSGRNFSGFTKKCAKIRYMLQCVTAGESHGQALVAIMSGLPAGVEVSTAEVAAALKQRRCGYGRGARQSFEADEVTILSGMRHGKSLGSPVALTIANSEWPKWTAVMNPDVPDPQSLLVNPGKGDAHEAARNERLTTPRPGHADFAGMMKYGHDDARNVLERSSARETAARVALGVFAEALLAQAANIHLVSHVIALGEVSVPIDSPAPVFTDTNYLNADPMRCFDVKASARMVDAVDAAKKSGDTLGGVVQVIAYGVPVGLGSYATHETRLDARLAAAVMSIQAVKGVEIGQAFLQASLPGSQAHDALYPEPPQHPGDMGIKRLTNLAGGIEGGISNGSPVVVNAAVKPISTVPNALPTIDLDTGLSATGLHQRSDTTAVVPAAVIAQSEVATVLASALLEKTGGDSVTEVKRNLDNYVADVSQRLIFDV